MCYSLWYNAPTKWPAGSLEAEDVAGRWHRPATSWVHYTTSCYTQSSAPEDGRDHRPKHFELIGIINKPLLLHLVGVYAYIIYLLLQIFFSNKDKICNVPYIFVQIEIFELLNISIVALGYLALNFSKVVALKFILETANNKLTKE